jgi:hypothetical protein
MNCEQLNDTIDDYMDGGLDEADAGVFDAHVANCAACTELVQAERRLHETMQRYAATTVPRRDAAYFDRALAIATVSGAKHRGRVSWFRGFASAAAAGLALWIIGGLLNNSPSEVGPGAAIPAVTMTLEQPQTVNLVFSSASDLDQATLRLLLPAGVEIAGFAGQSEIAWTTSLRQGKNILPLKLIATSPQGGVVLATLQHDDGDRSFRLLVNIT